MKTKATTTPVHDASEKLRGGKQLECKCNADCSCCEEKKSKKLNAEKKSVVLMASLFLLSVTTVFGQDASAKTFWDDPFNSPMLSVYLMLGFIVVTIVLTLVVMVYLTRVLNILMKQVEKDKAERAGITLKPEPTWWDKFWQRANDSIPVSEELSVDTGHNYDGIRELDNHLPPWWTGLFYATIVWGVIYLIAYHITSSLPLSGEEYAHELQLADDQAKALAASKPAMVIDENALEYKAEAAILMKGQQVFTTNNCASCHRNDGGGNNIGPNLTDQYWLHGGSIKDIYSTINKGVVEKGMPAWGKVMSAEDVRDVAFYVMSLQGTKPADPKGPQGELYTPPTQNVPADTVKASAMVK